MFVARKTRALCGEISDLRSYVLDKANILSGLFSPLRKSFLSGRESGRDQYHPLIMILTPSRSGRRQRRTRTDGRQHRLGVGWNASIPSQRSGQ